jgi:hypothetical protein
LTRIEEYRKELRNTADWDAFLRKNSGLPGPRGNLELAQAAAEEGDRELFERYVRYTPDLAPENTPGVFLAFCGIVGMGRLVAEGQTEYLQTLRECSTDPRWRIREGVAMALQRVGEKDMDALIKEMDAWSRGNPLEQRAAAAALCEPGLLRKRAHSRKVLRILDRITASIRLRRDRKGDAFAALRKGMGYCWSVAAASDPEDGKKLMEKWMESTDPDIRWIMRENLKKNRLIRCDEQWAGKMIRRIT